MGKILLVGLLLAGLGYLLYVHGYLLVNAVRALSFIGSIRGNQASFSSCSGYIKRIVRFQADKTCTITLEAELTKGEVTMELLDSAKKELMRLDASCPQATISVEKRKKYYLLIRFKSATGKYVLRWN